jgi:site-specific recombinase XerD
MRTTQPTCCTSTADSEVVTAYLSWLRDVRRRSPATIDSYRSTLSNWMRWLVDHDVRRLADGRLADLEAFQNRPRQKRGRGGTGAAATQRREVISVRGFYAWMAQRGHVDVDPMTDALPPAQPHRMPRPIADDVWLRAWSGDLPDGLRAALGLGFFCGLRRAEIVSLTVDQLTDSRIVGFVRKGGGEDTTPWRSLVDVYAQHLPHLGHEQFVSSLGMVRRRGPNVTVYREPDGLNRRMRKAGLEFTPHQLRHSCATNLIRAGVPLPIVSRMMNHTSVTTTMLYVKAGGDELRDWLKSG